VADEGRFAERHAGCKLLQGGPFALTQTHGHPESPSYRHGLGVMVLMGVRDEKLGDVCQAVPDLVQRPSKGLLALGQRPASVNQHQLTLVLDGVDVDRA
jgi:hypothetical protein